MPKKEESMYQVDQTTYYELELRAIRSLFLHELGLTVEQVDMLMGSVDTEIYCCTLEAEGYREEDREAVQKALSGEEDVLYTDWQDYLRELVVRKVLPAGRYLLWIY